MTRRSAGVLVWRRTGSGIEVLLVHPGGPFWRNKAQGAWSLPKGEYGEGEDPEAAARREFAEETGWTLDGKLILLGEVRQAAGKVVTGFAVEGDFNPATAISNSFEMEWPPKSGRRQSFPEVDRAEWFSLAQAAEKINPSQRAFLERLAGIIGGVG